MSSSGPMIAELFYYSLAALSVFPGKFGIVSQLSDISLGFLVLKTAAAVALFYCITCTKLEWARS